MLKDVTTGLKKNKTLYSVVCFAVIVVIIIVVYKIYKGIRTASVTLGQAGQAEAINISTGIPVNRINFIVQKAADLWKNDVTTYWLAGGTWTGAVSYNEAAFVDAINLMTSEREVALLNQSFHEHAGYGLKKVLDSASFISKKEIDRINPAWLTVIKAS